MTYWGKRDTVGIIKGVCLKNRKKYTSLFGLFYYYTCLVRLSTLIRKKIYAKLCRTVKRLYGLRKLQKKNLLSLFIRNFVWDFVNTVPETLLDFTSMSQLIPPVDSISMTPSYREKLQ